MTQVTNPFIARALVITSGELEGKNVRRIIMPHADVAVASLINKHYVNRVVPFILYSNESMVQGLYGQTVASSALDRDVTSLAVTHKVEETKQQRIKSF